MGDLAYTRISMSAPCAAAAHVVVAAATAAAATAAAAAAAAAAAGANPDGASLNSLHQSCILNSHGMVNNGFHHIPPVRLLVFQPELMFSEFESSFAMPLSSDVQWYPVLLSSIFHLRRLLRGPNWHRASRLLVHQGQTGQRAI